jgi:hypothetical protein
VIAILAVLVVLALPGCADERTFEAGELVDELNENGARLGLGASLSAGQDEVELFAVSFAGDVGTLAITEDADAGLGEYHRCEDAATLTCYRAANAVLYFELPAGDPQLAPLDAAIRALASD